MGFVMMRPNIFSGLFLSVFFVFSLACEVYAKKIHVAVPGFSQNMAFSASKMLGFYQAEDLDVEFVLMSAGTAVQALIGGSVDFALVGGAAVTSILRGAPIRFVLASFYRPVYFVYARPELREIKDLKGKKLGVANVGAASDFLLREALGMHGLNDKEVAILGIGLPTTRVAALMAGTIDATIVNIPHNFRLQQAGFRELLAFPQLNLVELSAPITVRDKFLQDEASVVERFIRATLRGIHLARNDRSRMIPIIANNVKVDETLAAKTYDLYRAAMSSDGTISEELQKKSLEIYVKLAGIKTAPALERIFDFRMTRKIYGELENAGWR
jgi:ABC-type nitrate/sulfonate/bicarbonate transport system substrate-binding protein